MKKINSLCSIVLILSMLFCFSAVRAEEQELENFDELIKNLLMENHFSQEQIKAMFDERIAEKEDYYSKDIPFMRSIGKPYYTQRTDEELMNEFMGRYRDWIGYDYCGGVLASELTTIDYGKEYFDSKCFYYLISDEQYWSTGTFPVVYDMNGNYVCEADRNKGVSISKDAYDLLKNPESIKNELIKRGEKKVDRVVIFNITYDSTFLYIKCEENEYLVKLYVSMSTQVALFDIELHKVYTAEEVVNAMFKESGADYRTRIGFARKLKKSKPTFEAEAEELHNEGLLQGNENGLDLLKPLTRIEAATMLLRAMNQSTEATDTEQTFSDVPQEHWGFGAAKNAQRLGLVKGVGDNKFAPNDKVTATQFSTMILRASNQQDFDWEKALNILIDEGVISQEDTKAMDLFTRGDMAKIIYEAKQKGLF